MIPARHRTMMMVLGVIVLLLLRAVAGALLPLSADEAYYWLWSKHLAWGYFDHPPIIAFLIRAGTSVFGDTPIGLRALPLLLSIVASWAVWRAGTILIDSATAGMFACLLFNLTLMTTVELTFATPDAPAMALAALFLLSLAIIVKEGNGYWWLAAGVVGGLGLLSKYTFLFLGISAAASLLVDPKQRFWLRTPWPYLGGFVALIIFAPNLWWNATHHWATFGFQLGRLSQGRVDPRYIFEFLGSQIGLASPLVLLLGVLGLLRWRNRTRASLLLQATMCPALIYFAVHSLHDRVQGNWPSFLYPALAVAAAAATYRHEERPAANWLNGFLRRWTVPVAAVVLGCIYLQLTFGLIAIGRKDPMDRLLAFGFEKTSQDLQHDANTVGTKTFIATNYQTASWMRFYLPPNYAVVQIGEGFRWPGFSQPTQALTRASALYISLTEKTDPKQIRQARFCYQAERARIKVIETYAVYCVAPGWKTAGAKLL